MFDTAKTKPTRRTRLAGLTRWVAALACMMVAAPVRADGGDARPGDGEQSLGLGGAGATAGDRSDPRFEAMAAVMGVIERATSGREVREPPRILPALRPEEPLATWRFELPVPVVKQLGNKTNCGPSAAAMAVVAYEAGERQATRVREARDAIGEWTWQTFPMRQMRLAGYDMGMTTRHMMKVSMEHFRPEVGWAPVAHPWLPLEAWSIITLKRALAERRPMVVLAEARTLWNLDAPGLHWVVVTGSDAGEVVFNDPADGTPARISLERFWTAWRLSGIYRSLPMVAGFEALVADRSLPVVHVAHPELRPERLPPMP